MSYNPRGRKESDMTEQLTTTTLRSVLRIKSARDKSSRFPVEFSRVVSGAVL